MSNETLKNDAKEIGRIAGTAAGTVAGMGTAALIVTALPIAGVALAIAGPTALIAGAILGGKAAYKDPIGGIRKLAKWYGK